MTRYLNKAGKKQVFSCVATHIITGVEVTLPEGKSYTVPPHRFVGELHENVPPAREWPKNSKADIAAALFRGAVEMAMKSGLEDLKISEAADQAGISHSDALQVLDPATSFTQQVDDYLDGVAKRTIGSQPASLPPGSHPVCLSKALVIGNIGLAMPDPDGFDIHTAITSRSIVPNTFEQSPENHDMGKAFETHLNITRMGIELVGGPRSSWTLYETSLDLWAVSHGLAKLLAHGPLHGLPLELKHDLIDPVLDCSTTSCIHRLGLTLPEPYCTMATVRKPAPHTPPS